MNLKASITRKMALVSIVLFSLATGRAAVASPAEELVKRILPEHYGNFAIEQIDSASGKDFFELESKAGKIVIRGNNAVSIASGLNWYLKYYCNAHISWCGNQLDLPEPLPELPQALRREAVCPQRYTFNYCTYGYSMAFWDWPRWQREIDFMALNGINLPLSIVGSECAVREVYLDMGLSEQEVGGFISGPAFLPWFLMGNLDGWGGPLPASWYEKQQALQKKILARQRELGMRAVLPAFAGHVPAAIKRVRPEANITRLKSWSGFAGTYVLSPDDELFEEIGARYVRKLSEMYGTDHLYSADTFNEMDPPTSDLQYLTDISRKVYSSMSAADPQAVWVMQGWLFLHGNFWTQPRIDALLGGVQDDKMIILDLFSTAKPQWQRTDAFSGKPWIWCMLHNWGGKQGMYGRMTALAEDLPAARNSPEAGNLIGLGSTQEGNDINPLVFDLLFEMAWRSEPVDVKDWTARYVSRRYGKDVSAAQQAWSILLEQLYSCTDKRHGPQGSYLAMRPTLSKNGSGFVRGEIFYDTSEVQRAFKLLLSASDELSGEETYQFDLVDLGRQVMSDLSQRLHANLRKAYEARDAKAFSAAAKAYLQAIKDTDKLLSTNGMFLADRWLKEPRAKADSPEEARLYEWNARDLITLWGGKSSTLHDYAQRQYAGMMGDFNYTRWEMFLGDVERSLAAGKEFNSSLCEKSILAYEESWTHSTNRYPSTPAGSPIAAARMIAEKYCGGE